MAPGGKVPQRRPCSGMPESGGQHQTTHAATGEEGTGRGVACRAGACQGACPGAGAACRVGSRRGSCQEVACRAAFLVGACRVVACRVGGGLQACLGGRPGTLAWVGTSLVGRLEGGGHQVGGSQASAEGAPQGEAAGHSWGAVSIGPARTPVGGASSCLVEVRPPPLLDLPILQGLGRAQQPAWHVQLLSPSQALLVQPGLVPVCHQQEACPQL